MALTVVELSCCNVAPYEQADNDVKSAEEKAKQRKKRLAILEERAISNDVSFGHKLGGSDGGQVGYSPFVKDEVSRDLLLERQVSLVCEALQEFGQRMLLLFSHVLCARVCARVRVCVCARAWALPI
jgi:hypothetical protein